MGSKVSRHIRSNVVGYVALFLAMTGSAAALSSREVENRNLASSSVDSRVVEDRSLHAHDLKQGAIHSALVHDGGLTGADIADNALTGQQIDESSLDPSLLQFRLQNGCGSGKAIQDVGSDGAVTCANLANGTITGITVSGGLTGGGGSGTVNVGVDPTQIQSRVNGDCSGSNAIQHVNQDGTVTCQPTGTGTVTSVGSGTGLTGGPITTSGSLAVDMSVVQKALAGQHCTPGVDAPMAFDSTANLACYPTAVGPDCLHSNKPSSQQQLCDFTPHGNDLYNLSLSDLRGAKFAGLDMTLLGVGSNLAAVNLRWGNLTNANLTGANLASADLEFADLTGATLTGANRAGVNWLMATCPDGHVVTTVGATC